MRKPWSLLVLAVLLWLGGVVSAQTVAPAASTAVEVHVFWRIGCPHCERAREFLQAAAARDDWLRLHEYEIGDDAVNRGAFERAVNYFGIQNPGVPTIVIGDRYAVGYHDDATTGVAILAAAALCRGQPDHCVR